MVFNANVVQQRKAGKQKTREKPDLLSPTEAKRTRQAAGWRGLSVDLITGSYDNPVSTLSRGDEQDSSVIDGTERLDGRIIKAIWRHSKLDRMKLRNIW